MNHFGVDTRNSRINQIVQLAERNRLRIINTFSRKEQAGNGQGSPNGETRKEIGFILTGKPDTVRDVIFSWRRQ